MLRLSEEDREAVEAAVRNPMWPARNIIEALQVVGVELKPQAITDQRNKLRQRGEYPE